MKNECCGKCAAPAVEKQIPARNWKRDVCERVSLQLNRRLNGGGCPGAGALGECAAVYDVDVSEDGARTWFAAEIYLWKAADGLAASTLAEWIRAAGVDGGCVISHVLHDPINETFDGRCSDGVRHFRAEFGVDHSEAGVGKPAGTEAPTVSVQLEQAARQIAIQSGADADEFVAWLLAGGFVEMVLAHFKAPQPAPEEVEATLAAFGTAPAGEKGSA